MTIEYLKHLVITTNLRTLACVKIHHLTLCKEWKFFFFFHRPEHETRSLYCQGRTCDTSMLPSRWWNFAISISSYYVKTECPTIGFRIYPYFGSLLSLRGTLRGSSHSLSSIFENNLTTIAIWADPKSATITATPRGTYGYLNAYPLFWLNF